MAPKAAASLDTTPLWIDSGPLPRFAKLDREDGAEVVVVGGGITGLTAAYLLARDGRSVIVLERARCAAIDTGHTSAHLTMVTDVRLTDLMQSFGRNHAQAAWDAGLAAINQIDTIVHDEAIDCGFAWVPGYLHRPLGAASEDLAGFADEANAAADLGFDAELVADVPFAGGPGVRYDNQARFHPRRYLAGLARAIQARGGRIYEETAADEFSDAPRTITANGHTISCEYVILATHTPLMGTTNIASASLFQTKLALYTSYVIAGRIATGRIEDALYWDTADPYHYVRLERQRDHDVIIFGGADHKTGQEVDTPGCFDRMAATLRALVPDVEITHRWSGQVIETPDGLPYIGETAERQFAATGFSGNGMTFGTLGAMMAADRVLGRTNPWERLFDPSRRKLRGAAWDYITENKDYPYYLVRDRFAGAEGRSLRAVHRGEGRILDIDGTRVAAYRDERGAVVRRSATCTHMGCEVAWNSAERSWDCPCHGSRFRPDGQVIAGPAEEPLGEPD